jgi:hypothetical protein
MRLKPTSKTLHITEVTGKQMAHRVAGCGYLYRLRRFAATGVSGRLQRQ